MTAADYARIRRRLDHPSVVIWKPCTAAPGEEDADWPAPIEPGWAARAMEALPVRTRTRCLLVAASQALITFELGALRRGWGRGGQLENRPRRALVLTVRWLGGEPISSSDLRSASASVQQALLDADRSRVPPIDRCQSAADAIAGIPLVPTTPDGEGLASIAFRIMDHASQARFRRPRQNTTGEQYRAALHSAERSFLRTWWARCRALVPIADVTTAEIEWGEIELPPQPVADDLTGDGGER